MSENQGNNVLATIPEELEITRELARGFYFDEGSAYAPPIAAVRSLEERLIALEKLVGT